MKPIEENIVKKVCKEFNLTYRELGEQIGIKEGTINKIASTGEISEQINKSIELYLKTIELEKELSEYREFRNFLKKITASASLHYRTHARCKPLNKESESPFFLAKLDIEYYTSGYTPASWEVGFLKVKSPITSDVVEIPGFNVNTNKEAVIFISDIPYLQSSLMDYFKKKEDIKLKQEEYKKNRENHIALKETFGSSQESAKEIFSIIEDLRIKQLKIQESLKIQEIVYKTHLDELQKQYEKDNPFDYTVIVKLQSELLDIDTEVNKILNKK